MRPADHELDTADGPVPYDVLVLATGAEPIRLPGTRGRARRASAAHPGRRRAAAARCSPRQHDIVVVGAGWIGAEFATAAREAGCAVTVVEAADRPLAGALPAEVAAPMAAWYADAGAALRTHARVARVEPGAVVLDDGTRLPAGAVVVGIGARPATGLADRLRHRTRRAPRGRWPTTTCAPPRRTCTRSATAPPSLRGGTASACWSTTGTTPSRARARWRRTSSARPPTTPAVYDPVPYFWSEQFGRFVQYAGHHAAADDDGVARRPVGPGLVACAGCARAGWSPCWRWAARGTWRRAARLIEAGDAAGPRRCWRTRRCR